MKETALFPIQRYAKWFCLALGLIMFGLATNAYTIQGDSVIYEDATAKLVVTPHTCYSPVGDCTQTFELTNKSGISADFYLGYIFDKPIQKGSASLWIPSSYGWVSHSKTCSQDYNVYTNFYVGQQNPNKAKCFYKDANGIIGNNITIWENAYKTANAGTKTIYYDLNEMVSGNNWQNVSSHFQQANYGNKKAYYTNTALTMQSGQTRKWQINYTPNASDKSGKWDMLAWIGTPTCILNNSCIKTWTIDPWFQQNYNYRKQLTIALQDANMLDTNTTIDINLNTTALIAAGKMRNDCKDLEIVKGDTNTLKQRQVLGCNSTTTHVRFRPDYNINATDTNYYIYYGNATDTIDQNDLTKVYWFWQQSFTNLDGWEQTNVVWSAVDGKARCSSLVGTSIETLSYPIGSSNSNFILTFDETNLSLGGDVTTFSGVSNVKDIEVSQEGRMIYWTSVTNQYYHLYNAGFTGAPNFVASTWLDGNYGIDFNYNFSEKIKLKDTEYATLDFNLANLNYTYKYLAFTCRTTVSMGFDLNNIVLMKTVSSKPIITFAAEETSSLTADFNYTTPLPTIDTEIVGSTAIVNFTNLTNYNDPAIQVANDYNWDVNGVRFSDLNNPSYTFTVVGDYNIALTTDTNTGKVSQMAKTISIKSAPTGLDFNYVVADYNNRMDVNFHAYNTSGTAIYNWRTIDENQMGQDTNKTFTTDGNKNICVTASISDANKTVCKTFYVGRILVHPPIDETNGIVLKPYGIAVSGNFGQDFNYVSSDKNIFLFNNTATNYLVTIDKNSDYYPRNYAFTLVPTTSWTLQPYLSKIADAIYATIFVFDATDKKTRQGITIKNKKYIGGVLTEVESTITDSSGQGNLTLIPADTYFWEFYDTNNTLVTTKEMRPTTTTYYVYLNLTGTIEPPPTTSNAYVIWTPTKGTASGNPFNLIAEAVAANVETFATMNLKLSIDGNTFYNTTKAVSPWVFNINIDTSGIPNGKTITAIVTLTTTAGTTYTFTKAFVFRKTFNWLDSLRGIRQEEGEVATLILALIITILACGLFTVKVAANYDAVAIIAMIILAFFFWIGWVSWVIFGFAVAAGIGLLLLSRSSQGGI